ncbi:type II intron maturase [Ureibacillus xyleni]|uniref:Type II intron maturase n=1 Tax=Ureibacillus xyleni TaxID=614648 RepID=A0A285S5I0_9BACL|nr:reverse transcriptase/maturase family protein [Ureibacillus xyleni]SOC02562.1 type II intron maturase [Ureibacillus xyleni]
MASNPFQQLSVYRNISRKNQKIKDCYRLLYHKDLWLKAYTNLCSDTMNVTNGTSFKMIDEMIEQLQQNTFRFSPMHRKPDSSQIVFNFKDKLVLEVMSIILSHIYEPIFSKHSHGFIGNRSYQSALLEIKNSWNGVTWCIQGVLDGESNREHQKNLLKWISKKIDDRRFLLLIHNALSCGVMTKWHLEKTDDGAQQPRQFSMLLLNIYLHELDTFIEHVIKQKSNYCKMKYVRFAHVFIIGVSSPKEDAQKLKSLIECFINNNLQLRIARGTTNIRHIGKGIPFLGYQISKCKRNYIQLNIPARALHSFALKNGYGNLDDLTIKHRKKLVNLCELEILSIYNLELKKFGNYYKLADNFHLLNKLLYIAEHSFIKTIAIKRRSSSKKVAISMRKHRQGHLSLVQQNKTGEQIIHTFLKLKDFHNYSYK